MNKIRIAGNGYDFKLTLASWKELKKNYDLTPTNFNEKINEDFANILSAIIYFGLSPEDRKNINQQYIDENVDLSVIGELKNLIESSLVPVVRKDDDPKN